MSFAHSASQDDLVMLGITFNQNTKLIIFTAYTFVEYQHQYLYIFRFQARFMTVLLIVDVESNASKPP